MACDIPELLDEARCLQCAIPQGMLGYAQLASLCLLSESGGGGLFVLRAGDTMTGELVLADALPSLQFGGTTSAFPALGNSGADLHVVLADGSAFANVTAGFILATQVDAGVATQPVCVEAYHNVNAGTPAIACGAAFDFRCDSDTTDRQLQTRISSLWSTVTHATRTSEFRFFTVLAAATTEALRISNAQIDARNNAVFAFNGVQVVSARNTGWTTFTGTANKNAGALDTGTVTTAQLAQVVKSILDALIAHGLVGT